MTRPNARNARPTGGECAPNGWEMRAQRVGNARLTGCRPLWEIGSLQPLQPLHPLRGRGGGSAHARGLAIAAARFAEGNAPPAQHSARPLRVFEGLAPTWRHRTARPRPRRGGWRPLFLFSGWLENTGKKTAKKTAAVCAPPAPRSRGRPSRGAHAAGMGARVLPTGEGVGGARRPRQGARGCRAGPRPYLPLIRCQRPRPRCRPGPPAPRVVRSRASCPESGHALSALAL